MYEYGCRLAGTTFVILDVRAVPLICFTSRDFPEDVDKEPRIFRCSTAVEAKDGSHTGAAGSFCSVSFVSYNMFDLRNAAELLFGNSCHSRYGQTQVQRRKM